MKSDRLLLVAFSYARIRAVYVYNNIYEKSNTEEKIMTEEARGKIDKTYQSEIKNEMEDLTKLMNSFTKRKSTERKTVEQYREGIKRRMPPIRQPSLTGKKRVICLYRVSTKKQVNGIKGNDSKDDIDQLPVQRKMCREFMLQHDDWELVDERVEPGLSAYKLPFEKREVLKELLAEAQEGLYDILLYVSNDRFGRRGADSTVNMARFYKEKVIPWSIMEGAANFDDPTLELLLNITNSISKLSSTTTSWKVAKTHRQLAEAGEKRGGTTPYGYDEIWNGEFNAKGVPVKYWVVNEEQAQTIREMYNLVYERGWGTSRITEYLNDKGSKTKGGNIWSRASVNTILRNTIYKGYRSYNKTRRDSDNEYHKNPKEEWIFAKEKNETLAIIPEELWDSVNKKRESKSVKNRKKHDYVNPHLEPHGSKSPLILIGLATCGHCNSRMTTSYSYSRWKKKNKETGVLESNVKVSPIYRCNGKVEKRKDEHGNRICNGPSTHMAYKIEDRVIEQTFLFVEQLRSVDFKSDLDRSQKEKKIAVENAITEKAFALKEHYNVSQKINKKLLGLMMSDESDDYTAVIKSLNTMLKDIEHQIADTKSEIEVLKKQLSNQKIEDNEILLAQNELIGWEDAFNKGTTDEKRMMLSRFIDNIAIFKDNIEIDFRVHFNQYVNGTKTLQQYNCNMCQSKQDTNTAVIMFHKTVVTAIDKAS